MNAQSCCIWTVHTLHHCYHIPSFLFCTIWHDHSSYKWLLCTISQSHARYAYPKKAVISDIRLSAAEGLNVCLQTSQVNLLHAWRCVFGDLNEIWTHDLRRDRAVFWPSELSDRVCERNWTSQNSRCLSICYPWIEQGPWEQEPIRFYLVTRGRFELSLPPWKGSVLTTWLTCHLALPAGLEPATSWLTVMRSTDWAIEEYCGRSDVIRTRGFYDPNVAPYQTGPHSDNNWTVISFCKQFEYNIVVLKQHIGSATENCTSDSSAVHTVALLLCLSQNIKGQRQDLHLLVRRTAMSYRLKRISHTLRVVFLLTIRYTVCTTLFRTSSVTPFVYYIIAYKYSVHISL